MDKDLKTFAKKIRINILKMLNKRGFGHFGGSLSVVETLAVLYGKVMKIDPKNPNWNDRDYFVLSKGHAGPALYSTLALKGFFPESELYTLNDNGTNLPSHPDRLKTKGVDATTGSLGQGISIAAGIAQGLKITGKTNKVYAIVGDGELNEGQCWEAFQFIAHRNLTNLIIFVDNNKLQLDGPLEEIAKPFDLVKKFESFGFDSKFIKGDCVEEIQEAIYWASQRKRPTAIILNTIKGKGLPFVENTSGSHHLRLNQETSKLVEEVIAKLEKEVNK